MLVFLAVCVLLVYLCYRSLCWILPLALRWYCKHNELPEVCIGKFNVFSFAFINIRVVKDGMVIHVDKIKFTSSFFSRDVTRPVHIICHDIRIERDIQKKKSKINYDEIAMSPKIFSMIQFVGIEVLHADVFLRDSASLVMATVERIALNGTLNTPCSGSVQLIISSLAIRLHSRGNSDSCLAQISGNIISDMQFVSDASFRFSDISCVVENPDVTIWDPRGIFGCTKQREGFGGTSKVSWLPDNFDFCVRDVNGRIKDAKSFSIRQCSVKWTNLANLIASTEGEDLFELTLEILAVTVESGSREKLFFLESLTQKLIISSGFEEIDAAVDLRSCYASFDLSMLPQLENSESDGNMLNNFGRTCRMKLALDVRDFSVFVEPRPASISQFLSCSQIRMSGNFEGNDGNFYEDVSGELLVEDLSCSLSRKRDQQLTSRSSHHWGNIFGVGVTMITFRFLEKILTVQAVLDRVQGEWSDDLKEFLVDCSSEVVRKNFGSRPGKRNFISSVVLQVNCKLVDVFMVTKDGFCLRHRVDQIILDTEENDQKLLHLRGFKIMTLFASDVKKVKLDDIHHTSLILKVADVKYWWRKPSPMRTEMRIAIDGRLHLRWETRIHLAYFHVWEALNDSNFLGFHRKSNVANVLAIRPVISASFCGALDFEILLNPDRVFSLHTGQVEMSNEWNNPKKGVRFETDRISVGFDSHLDIFTVQKISVESFPVEGDYSGMRSDWEELMRRKNRAWKWTIASFAYKLPYKYNFAQAFNNELMAVRKWLKNLHGWSSEPFKKDSRLPADFMISIGKFSFELSDDPFETKLWENYSLMEDESIERDRREEALTREIKKLFADQLDFDARLKECRQKLTEKDSEIYIVRSKKLHSNADKNSAKLFTWIVTDVTIVALADPSFHGEENCLRVLRELDESGANLPDDVKFCILWCRAVMMTGKEFVLRLRDYPQTLIDLRNFNFWGKLVGAEQIPTLRAIRTSEVHIKKPWKSAEVERGMMPLKFYHGLEMDIGFFQIAYGPCWEPALAQYNLSLENVFAPSIDPSPPLPFWDKIRIKYHGSVLARVQKLTLLLHASLDPYNTTEEMALHWTNLVFDWRNAKFTFVGDLEVSVRTASKYDDCRLLHVPNAKLVIKLNWKCALGNADDHHSVSPCSPHRLPEYSSNVVHDSYRAFRSDNLDLNVSLDTRAFAGSKRDEKEEASVLFFASTCRWFENLKFILSGVSRPIRKGRLFNNLRPRKIPLSRHYRRVSFSISLDKIRVSYWMSAARQKGMQLFGGPLTMSSTHLLTLLPVKDGLKHRPIASWSILAMTCSLMDAEIWLMSALSPEDLPSSSSSSSDETLSNGKETPPHTTPEAQKVEERTIPSVPRVEKRFFLSLARTEYVRDGDDDSTTATRSSGQRNNKAIGEPMHKLVAVDLRGAWTTWNKDVVMSVVDGWRKSQALRKNLSRDVFKAVTLNEQQEPVGTLPPKNQQDKLARVHSEHVPDPTMLQKLIADIENSVAVCEDIEKDAASEEPLHGQTACVTDDVVSQRWNIELVNSQVLLRGCESHGYMIVCAAKALIVGREHHPVWRDKCLVSKTTWIGSFDGLQYYATVSAQRQSAKFSDILWLSRENIDARDATVISELPDLPEMVGSGHSVGGVVSTVVGTSAVEPDDGNFDIELQRIVSRCKCECFYVSYGDVSMEPGELKHVPPPPAADLDIWNSNQDPFDAVTLKHHKLHVSTNPLQYAMILDIVNNLVMQAQPRKKEINERLQTLRFETQLHSVADQRKPILKLQNDVRESVTVLRHLEREIYLVQKELDEEGDDKVQGRLLDKMKNLNAQAGVLKEKLYAESEELNLKLSVYNETQIVAHNSIRRRWLMSQGDNWANGAARHAGLTRSYELCFTEAQWRLTESDGQIGIADLVLRNFLYKKVTKIDESTEHLAELGYIAVKNLIPNDVYTDLLRLTEIQSNMPMPRQQRAMRVFCRDRLPVGGIAIKEHFEINLAPLNIALTQQFYKKLMKFLYPGKDPDTLDDENVSASSTSLSGSRSRKQAKNKQKSKTAFYVAIPNDVEKMKQRAEKNMMFVYVKTTELPIRLSYKGENKLYNCEDLRVTVPVMEVHNMTWTWLDFLLAVKDHSKMAFVTQFFKQKIKPRGLNSAGSVADIGSEGESRVEEEEIRKVQRDWMMPGGAKPQKKGFFNRK